MADYEYRSIPRMLEEKEVYPEGANAPTRVTVYECLCKKGRIEYHCVPGFGDDWFEIRCKACEKRYTYIERCGYQWRVYLP